MFCRCKNDCFRVEALDHRFDNLDQRVDGIKRRFDGLVNNRFESVETKKAIRDRQEETNAKLENLNLRAHKLQSELVSMVLYMLSFESLIIKNNRDYPKKGNPCIA
ncbi:hypothetical protein K0H71_17515 [Bacillus sp. IITD106]|nr:hypothetical protein [Bacillus sp. IITD106]